MTNANLGILALCAASGFSIVWLSLSSKKASAAADQGKPEPEPEAEPQSEQEPESRKARSHAGARPRWCDILLVEPDASEAEIRRSYTRLMKGLHPDVAGPDPQASARCATVKNAYEEARLHVRRQA